DTKDTEFASLGVFVPFVSFVFDRPCESAALVYEPPSANVSVQGLRGWASVPRMPSSKSIFNVRKRSSGLVNRISRTRLGPLYCDVNSTFGVSGSPRSHDGG